MERISVKGTEFYAGGKKILLQGVNLGGWFVTELWMTPWIDQDSKDPRHKIIDDFTLYQLLETRFGLDQSQQIRNQWRKNWITNADFASIQAGGFNLVRLPFRDELIHEPGGLNWLINAVKMAQSHHLYVVLDMHGIPGGQSTDQPTGHANQNYFWTHKDDQIKYLEDWKLLAKTFAGNPTVAMYDLMNEPMGAPQTQDIFDWQLKAMRVIRTVDKHTVISFEDGYRGWDKAPSAKTPDRENVCFQPHHYNFDAKSEQDHLDRLPPQAKQWDEIRVKDQVPIYIGEWNVEPFGGPKVIKPMTDAFRQHGFSWSFWTWKVDPVKGELGDWGIMRPGPERTAIDPFHDSFDQIMLKLKQVNSRQFVTPQDLIPSFGLASSSGD